MTSKLLSRDRALWVLTSLLYLALGVAAVVASGPLTWAIRAEIGGTAGSAGVLVGSVSGVLLAGGVLAAVCRRRLRSPVLPVAAIAAGVIATFLGGALLSPLWLGFLALAPALLGLVAFLGSKKAIAYQADIEEDAKKPKGKRTHETADMGLMLRGDAPDGLLTGGLAALVAAVGVIACLSTASMTTWFAPKLPAELQSSGQVVVGEGNPVKVQMLYGINYPHAAQLLGDGDSTLAALVEDGTVELTLQGIALPEETRLSVPVREAEACAWEVGGADAVFEYTTAYNQNVLAGSLDSDVEDLAAAAGKGLGDEFSKCLKSGKYELQAGVALEESADFAQNGLPRLYIDGEDIQPESLADFKEMILEAA